MLKHSIVQIIMPDASANKMFSTALAFENSMAMSGAEIFLSSKTKAYSVDNPRTCKSIIVALKTIVFIKNSDRQNMR